MFLSCLLGEFHQFLAIAFTSVCLPVCRWPLELWVYGAFCRRICLHRLRGYGSGSVVKKTARKYSQTFSPGSCCVEWSIKNRDFQPISRYKDRGSWNPVGAFASHPWCRKLSTCVVLVLPRRSHTAHPLWRKMFYFYRHRLRYTTRIGPRTHPLHCLHRWSGADRR